MTCSSDSIVPKKSLRGEPIMDLSDASTVLGGLLIVVGLVMTVYQFMKAYARDDFRSRTAKFTPKSVELKTTYPGIILIGIGAVMVMAGGVFGS
jgi:hypothetical protein